MIWRRRPKEREKAERDARSNWRECEEEEDIYYYPSLVDEEELRRMWERDKRIDRVRLAREMQEHMIRYEQWIVAGRPGEPPEISPSWWSRLKERWRDRRRQSIE